MTILTEAGVVKDWGGVAMIKCGSDDGNPVDLQHVWVRLHEFLDSLANLFRLNTGRKTDRRTLFPCDLLHQHACCKPTDIDIAIPVASRPMTSHDTVFVEYVAGYVVCPSVRE